METKNLTKQKQNADVLGHLQMFNFITPKIAREHYAIERVASIIHRLRTGYYGGKQYNIKTEIISSLNRFKQPCTHARYRLIK